MTRASKTLCVLLASLAGLIGCVVPDDEETIDPEEVMEDSLASGTQVRLLSQGFFLRGSSGSVPGYVLPPASVTTGPVEGHTTSTFHDLGSAVTLTPVPAAGSFFLRWATVGNYPGCSYVSGTSCTVVMDQERWVEAQFDRYSARVAKTSTGGGGGTVRSSPAGITCGTTCFAPFAQNASVVLTAALNGNSAVTWTGCDSATATTCTVRINGARAVTAGFRCGVPRAECESDCMSICAENGRGPNGETCSTYCSSTCAACRIPYN